MTTEPVTREDRCDKCGLIRITMDNPVDLTDSDEILLDDVWAVFREHVVDSPPWKLGYMDSLFHTEASARAEMKRQIDARGDDKGEWIGEGETCWKFDRWGDHITIGKVSVRL